MSLGMGINSSRHMKKPTLFQYTKREQTNQEGLQAYITSAYLWKIFEKVILDAIYEHLANNQLLTPNQSGFHPGDSTINQLLYITHRIYGAFEEFPSHETRAVFLYMSKAFDKVWHGDLILKLKNYGISGPLIALIKSYFSHRK